ncbi:MAG: glycosyltransferase family 4 protein [Planctomycetes bacterium]|nr:glycosyltransferase family 4 protein [Planctomycetota bacterium]
MADMKIAYVLGRYPCLSETFAAREMATLRKMGQKIFVFANDGRKSTKQRDVFYKPAFFSPDGIYSVLSFFVKKPMCFFRFWYLVFRLFVESAGDGLYLARNIHTAVFFCRKVIEKRIEHVHSYFLSRPACIGLAVSKLAGVDFSIGAHARDIYVESGALRVKVERAKFIVCCTASGQRYLRGKLGAKHRRKVYLNYHGVEDCYVERKRGTSELKILSVGRLVRKKGFDYFIRAMAIVVKNRPEVKAEIIGSGYEERKLKELVVRLGVAKHVCFGGAKSHRETLKAIGRADILVAASVVADDGDRDGIPNVVLEAFASGCAVLASNLETIREVVKDGKTGLIVAPEQVQELADAILRLVDDQELRKYLADNAYRFVRENFDSRKNAQRLIGLFQGGKICRRK